MTGIGPQPAEISIRFAGQLNSADAVRVGLRQPTQHCTALQPQPNPQRELTLRVCGTSSAAISTVGGPGVRGEEGAE